MMKSWNPRGGPEGTQLSETAKPLIQKLFDKTYLIGRSLPDELTTHMHGSISFILRNEPRSHVHNEVRQRLLGTQTPPSSSDPGLLCLTNIQTAYDRCALNDDRAEYRKELLIVASRYELSVPGEDEVPRRDTA